MTIPRPPRDPARIAAALARTNPAAAAKYVRASETRDEVERPATQELRSGNAG